MASRRRIGMNPAFAAAHGLAKGAEDRIASGPAPPERRLERILDRARETGRLEAAGAGLARPLPDGLFDLRAAVELSMDASGAGRAQAAAHAEETLSLVDLSDNPGIGGATLDDGRLARFEGASTLRMRRCAIGPGVGADLSSMRSLRVLDLSGNALAALDLGLLPESLAELHLQGNVLESLVCGRGTKRFPHLALLDVSENRLDALPDECFSESGKLVTFRCGKNRLPSLPSFLRGSCRGSLQVLDAAHNRLGSSFSSSSSSSSDNAERMELSGLANLRSVDLGSNGLAAAPRLGGAVQRVDLTANRLATIEGAFDDTSSSLVDLLLRDNHLRELPAEDVQRWKALRRLDLSHNMLRTLPYQLGFLPQLRSVNVHGNPLLTFKSSDLGSTAAILQVLRNRAPKGAAGHSTDKSSLLAMGMRQRSLQLASRCGGPPSPTRSEDLLTDLMKELEASPQQAFEISELVLDRNRLESIPDGLFPLLPSVSELSLCDNFLTALPSALESSLSRLRKLLMARNRLVRISELPATSVTAERAVATASWCQYLVHLDLSANRLTELPASLLRGMVRLRVLNVSSNRLDNSVERWDRLPPTLHILDLSDNRIGSEAADSLAIVLGACCPDLQSLSLANNDIRKIPYEIGLLSKTISGGGLKSLNLVGNPQQMVRPAILEKPCQDQLEYLYNRMTKERREKALTRMVRLARANEGKGDTAAAAPNAAASVSTAACNDISKVAMVEAGRKDEEKIPSVGAISAKDGTGGKPPQEESGATSQNKPSRGSASIASLPATGARPSLEDDTLNSRESSIDQLQEEIRSLQTALDNPSLSQAKLYAIKKSLAMSRSKLLREERIVSSQ